MQLYCVKWGLFSEELFNKRRLLFYNFHGARLRLEIYRHGTTAISALAQSLWRHKYNIIDKIYRYTTQSAKSAVVCTVYVQAYD